MPVIADGATRGESDLRLAMAEEADRIESWARTWDSTYRALAHRWSGWNSALVAAAALERFVRPPPAAPRSLRPSRRAASRDAPNS